ncbi:fibrous sheath CABYR-binding protein-like [Penaeus indicus]|uniref:fibrous sheath CABYR-binding protein-like n=1 Tax=Penaeus indicus TaxID=29960 RepID=UPI00300D1421
MQETYRPATAQSSAEEDPRQPTVPVAAQEPTAGRVLSDVTQEKDQQQPPKKVSSELRIPNTYELADKKKGKRTLEAPKDSQPTAKKLKVPAEEAQKALPQAPEEAADQGQKPLPQAPKVPAEEGQKPLPQAPKEAAGQKQKPPKMPKVNFLTYDRETQRKVQNYLRKYRRKYTVAETPQPSN